MHLQKIHTCHGALGENFTRHSHSEMYASRSTLSRRLIISCKRRIYSVGKVKSQQYLKGQQFQTFISINLILFLHILNENHVKLPNLLSIKKNHFDFLIIVQATPSFGRIFQNHFLVTTISRKYAFTLRPLTNRKTPVSFFWILFRIRVMEKWLGQT